VNARARTVSTPRRGVALGLYALASLASGFSKALLSFWSTKTQTLAEFIIYGMSSRIVASGRVGIPLGLKLGRTRETLLDICYCLVGP
jgi:hypothetical protein